MAKLFIEDLKVEGKRVIVRVDFNVPLKDGVVENDKRLVASLPTIEYLLKHNAKVILMSHLGRPDGKVKPEFSLKPVAVRLHELLNRPVIFLNDCVGPEVEAACSSMKTGDIILLENVRFHIEEEGKVKLEDGTKLKADPDKVTAFRAGLTRLADIYVNDAFGTAHRDHSSMTGVTLPQRACGYLVKKELDFLGSALDVPKRPFVAIIGGAKISGKIDVIEALLPKVDKLIIGGGMAFTFYKAMGLEIGKSLLEADRVDMAKALIQKGGDKLLLPIDTVITDKFDFNGRTVGSLKTVDVKNIPSDWEGVDIGEKSTAQFVNLIKSAKTVIWNGPMGVFEIEATAKGTMEVAKALAEATEKNGAITVIGGGDSASAVKKAGVQKKVSHVSTGGGASLEYLEGKQLPGVVALTDK
ncbi:MAG: phosphoglycerate kinase [Elusimicrobia bacterium RIFOXYB2_FULL_49_7]|nr:MAG: phosphoglycerate kinase [Elusimicrobia bacterium RIFOXYB2_FULL_49_7]